MYINDLFKAVEQKDFQFLSQALRRVDKSALHEVDAAGHTFKTLAIKTLQNPEFEEFCRILQEYYREVKLQAVCTKELCSGQERLAIEPVLIEKIWN